MIGEGANLNVFAGFGVDIFEAGKLSRDGNILAGDKTVNGGVAGKIEITAGKVVKKILGGDQMETFEFGDGSGANAF